MALKSVRIKNILSFEDCTITNFSDFNCIIGKNNVGKSNFLKVLEYFYSNLKNESVIPLPLQSNYSSVGKITITYDTTRLEEVIKSRKSKSDYQKHIYSSLFKDDNFNLVVNRKIRKEFKLTLIINSNGSISWSDKDKNVRKIINRIYPLFSIDVRKMDLYDWDKLWKTVSQLKFLNTKSLNTSQIVDFFDERVSKKSNAYKDYVKIVGELTQASPYNYQDMVLNYIKVGLSGHKFNIDGFELSTQSDGTNSHRFIELFLSLIITLTRREYITPIVYIDEPELGLHPKLNERLIYNLHKLYNELKKNTDSKKLGKYATPYPTVLMTTHSPNILKSVIKQFKNDGEHSVFHFGLQSRKTIVSLLNTKFKDKRFLNVFSDNEARLYFSDFILFVEGETELELFGNMSLVEKYGFLNKVDIYKTNEVMLRSINPRESKAPIPYLNVYDADKMLTYNFDNKEFILKKKEVNLHDLKDRYKYTTFISPNYPIKRALKSILTIDGVSISVNKKGTEFSKLSYLSFINKCNNILLKTDRVHVAPSTIEETLICKESRKMAIRWLINQTEELVEGTLMIGGGGDINKKLDSFRRRFKKDNIDYFYKNVFTPHEYNGDLSEENKDFVKQVLVLNLRKLLKQFYIKNDDLNRNDQVTTLRLALDGKTHTLCSQKSKNYESAISPELRNAVDNIKEQCLKKLPMQLGKTGGWVTSFLNFAIADIENESNTDSEFREKFSRIFPHLDDILKKISVSIV
ncbi:ATPase_AAA_core domain-containing protein [Vibrio chagasii]|nr:ATPase_AAA_core domain-containing protein [Vibrio chagasii]